MKNYTIKINNNNNTGFNFRRFNNNPSKELDDLILSNLIKMNPYLENKSADTIEALLKDTSPINDDHIIISNRDNSSILKDDFNTKFIKAANFLSNYTPTTKKSFTLFDGTPIEFFEDEIQIGYDLIPLTKLTSPKYYNTLSSNIKTTIINIFISINR